MTNRLYDVLKFLAQIVLPALGTLYFTLGEIWGLPAVTEVVRSIVALDTFLGVVLHLSASAYNRSDAKYDGDFVIEEKAGGGKTVSLQLNDDPQSQDLEAKDELRFKMQKPEEMQKRANRKRSQAEQERRKRGDWPK